MSKVPERLQQAVARVPKVSERAIPVHPQLVKLGFLGYVEARAREDEAVPYRCP